MLKRIRQDISRSSTAADAVARVLRVKISGVFAQCPRSICGPVLSALVAAASARSLLAVHSKAVEFKLDVHVRHLTSIADLTSLELVTVLQAAILRLPRLNRLQLFTAILKCASPSDFDEWRHQSAQLLSVAFFSPCWLNLSFLLVVGKAFVAANYALSAELLSTALKALSLTDLRYLHERIRSYDALIGVEHLLCHDPGGLRAAVADLCNRASYREMLELVLLLLDGCSHSQLKAILKLAHDNGLICNACSAWQTCSHQLVDIFFDFLSCQELRVAESVCRQWRALVCILLPVGNLACLALVNLRCNGFATSCGIV